MYYNPFMCFIKVDTTKVDTAVYFLKVIRSGTMSNNCKHLLQKNKNLFQTLTQRLLLSHTSTISTDREVGRVILPSYCFLILFLIGLGLFKLGKQIQHFRRFGRDDIHDSQ